MVGYVGSPHHFRCITVRTGSMLIKFVRTWARLPTLLAFVTHNRVNDGQIYLQLISPFQNSPTNRVSGTMSKAAGMFLAHFPRFMLKRRRRRPNSTKPLLFSPIFRSCTQLYDKAGSLYVNPCQTNKNKKPCCLLPIHLAYDEAGYMLLKVDTTIRKGFHRAVYKDYANV